MRTYDHPDAVALIADVQQEYVVRYGEVDLSTHQGFAVHWSFSAESAAQALSAGFAEMTRHPGAMAG